MKNMRKLSKLVLAACLFVTQANQEAYGSWETYLNKHTGQGVETPFWKNYENWNQWVTEATPADLTPSKNGLDNWRKWNLDKMAVYGENWQNMFTSQQKQENRRSELEQAPKQGTDEWKEWMKTRFVETNNLMSRPNPRVERDYPVAEKEKQPFGPYHHPKEVPDVKDPTNSNQDDWQSMIPAAYRGLMGSKQPTAEEEKARQGGDVNWRNYVPKSYRDVAPAWGIHDGVSAAPDNDFAERYNDKHSPRNTPIDKEDSNKESTKDKDTTDFTKYGSDYAKQYTGDNAKYAEKYTGGQPNGSDWSKYIPGGTGGDHEKIGHRYADKYSKSGSPDSGNDISKYTDWKKYIGDQGGNDWNKYIPGSNPGGGGGDQGGNDWNKYIPGSNPGGGGGGGGGGGSGWENYGGGAYTDWKKFAGGYGPPMTLIAKPKSNTDSDQPSTSDNNNNNQPEVDWHKYVPEAYRGFIPSDKTIDEANKNNAEGKPVDWRGFVPEAFRHYIPDEATIAEQEKNRKVEEGSNQGEKNEEEEESTTKPEVIIIVPRPESSEKEEEEPKKSQQEIGDSIKEKPNPTAEHSAKVGSQIQHEEIPTPKERHHRHRLPTPTESQQTESQQTESQQTESQQTESQKTESQKTESQQSKQKSIPKQEQEPKEKDSDHLKQHQKTKGHHDQEKGTQNQKGIHTQSEKSTQIRKQQDDGQSDSSQDQPKTKCENPKCGAECECGKDCECRKDTSPQSTNLATSNLASIHSVPPTTTWSGVAIVFLLITVLVGLFVGGYIFKRIKKRHFDYEQVAELDVDQLLLV